jgi:Ca2+/Na+ antiporter
LDWRLKINVGSLFSDQWIARGASAAGLMAVALASAFRLDRPIVATLLLTFGSILFIAALWFAARNRVRWLDAVVLVLCLASLALCSYRVTQQLKRLRSTAADQAESSNPDADHDTQ